MVCPLWFRSDLSQKETVQYHERGIIFKNGKRSGKHCFYCLERNCGRYERNQRLDSSHSPVENACRPWPEWSVGWVPFHVPASKGCWLHSWSGHMPELLDPSPGGGMQKAAHLCFAMTLIFFSFSFPFLSLSKSIKTNFKKCREWVAEN